ncbi:MAG: 50S ribosomal protein L29 [archaeon]|nr:50S ribosomal protein L29 [archaeon]
MKFTELNNKSKQDLSKQLQQNREKVRQMRFDIASGKQKNSDQLGKAKRDIARILTKMKQDQQ